MKFLKVFKEKRYSLLKNDNWIDSSYFIIIILEKILVIEVNRVIFLKFYKKIIINKLLF